MSFTALPAGSSSKVTLERGSPAAAANTSSLTSAARASSGVKVCHV